eukprot:m51a1_g5738 hypothetical protein (125) ;mRNA; f:1146541-1147034
MSTRGNSSSVSSGHCGKPSQTSTYKGTKAAAQSVPVDPENAFEHFNPKKSYTPEKFFQAMKIEPEKLILARVLDDNKRLRFLLEHKEQKVEEERERADNERERRLAAEAALEELRQKISHQPQH